MATEVPSSSKILVWQNLKEIMCKAGNCVGTHCICQPKPTMPLVSDIEVNNKTKKVLAHEVPYVQCRAVVRAWDLEATAVSFIPSPIIYKLYDLEQGT